jgi:hypothetical protein
MMKLKVQQSLHGGSIHPMWMVTLDTLIAFKIQYAKSMEKRLNSVVHMLLGIVMASNAMMSSGRDGIRIVQHLVAAKAAKKLSLWCQQ